jgi:predicted permease
MDWHRDAQIALRSLRRQPLFTLAVVGTLSLGIGASTATFGVAREVLLAPLPYAAPEQLVLVWGRTPDAGDRRLRIAGEDAARVQQEVDAIASAAFVLPAVDVLIGVDDGRAHALFARATSGLFDVLGTPAHLGQTFDAGDGAGTTGAVRFRSVVLSHAFWQDRFGGRRDVIGQNVSINGASVRVAGVMAPGFQVRLPSGAGFPGAVDGWLSIGPDPAVLARPTGLRDQDTDDTGVLIARHSADATRESVAAALAAVSSRIREQTPGLAGTGFELVAHEMRDDVVRDKRPAILAIAGAAAFVLLVACINVANLLLARLNARTGELAVRAALGAGRGRLVAQAMGESLLVSAAGGIAGVGMANVLTRALAFVDPERIGAIPSSVDGFYLVFAGFITVMAALACGLPTAMRAAATGQAMLAGGSRRIANGSILRTRRVLVGAEIALSLVLLTGAGLLLRSFVSLQRVDAGFDARNLITFGVTLPPGTVGGPGARARFMRTIGAAVRDVPGVRAVGLSGALPLTGAVWMQPWGLAGQPPAEWERNAADFRVITADYFEAMGTRLLAGRTFTAQEDVNEDGRVVIVDAELARLIAPAGNAVGRSLAFPLDGRAVEAEIVGIVEPVRHASLRAMGRPTLYVPYRQEASLAVGFAVRVEANAAAMIRSIRSAVDLAIVGSPAIVHDERLMQEWVDQSTSRERFTLVLAITFASTALLLAAIGLYGVIAFLVTQRTRELGIRAALGATARDIARDVLRDGVYLAAMGVAAGVGLAIAFGFVIRPLLFGVSFIDPLTIGVVAVTLGAVTLLACWVPARRASQIEPVTALRAD